MTMQFASGKKATVRLLGTYEEPKGGSPFGDAIISTALFDKHVNRPQDQMVLINSPDGVNTTNTATLKDDLRAFADAKVLTRSQFINDSEKPINRLLNLLYVLLALSVIVSLFDSLDFVDLIFAIEKEFGVRVREADFNFLAKLDFTSPTVMQDGFITAETLERLLPLLPGLANRDHVTPQQLFSFITAS